MPPSPPGDVELRVKKVSPQARGGCVEIKTRDNLKKSNDNDI